MIALECRLAGFGIQSRVVERQDLGRLAEKRKLARERTGSLWASKARKRTSVHPAVESAETELRTFASFAIGAAMRIPVFLLAATCLVSPALADHAGPSGVGGGSLNVISPDTLNEGAFAIGLRASYLRPNQRSDATLTALAGQHVHAHNTDYNLNSSVGVAYGATHELTLSLELPYVRREGLREGAHSHVGGQAVNGVERLGSVAGIGDASLLARYKLMSDPAATFAVLAGIKLPTGNTHRRSDEGERLETEHQPGTGSFDPIAGAAFGTQLGAVRLTASGFYQISGKGAQQTRLGNRAQAGVANHRPDRSGLRAP